MSVQVILDITNAQNNESSRVDKKHTIITPFSDVLNEKEKTSRTMKTYSNKDKLSEAPEKLDNEVVNNINKDGIDKNVSTSLKSIFRQASEKYDISYTFLVAVAKAESDFNPKCVSSAGAKGIMQIMPYECKEFGVTDPFDPKQNIMAAAKLLKAHLDKFDGNYTLAAAAYNAGSGTVKKYGGVPPYNETQNYVKKINKYMQEGVTVPDNKVTIKEKVEKKEFDQGQLASEKDLEKVIVKVGTGDDLVTMTYGAYEKYLEIGDLGVG